MQLNQGCPRKAQVMHGPGKRGEINFEVTTAPKPVMSMGKCVEAGYRTVFCGGASYIDCGGPEKTWCDMAGCSTCPSSRRVILAPVPLVGE